MTPNKCLKYNHPIKPQMDYTDEWFDLNHFSCTFQYNSKDLNPCSENEGEADLRLLPLISHMQCWFSHAVAYFFLFYLFVFFNLETIKLQFTTD